MIGSIIILINTKIIIKNGVSEGRRNYIGRRERDNINLKL
jgi:hypothetical protein